MHEWMVVYIPVLAAILDWFAQQIQPSLRPQDYEADLEVSQATGFIGVDGTAIRGVRKRKAQTRKEDQQAILQLSRVGDVKQVRYRFVSEYFLQRHGLGKYSESSEPNQEGMRKSARERSKGGISIQPEISFGSDGVEVGLGLSTGGKSRVNVVQPPRLDISVGTRKRDQRPPISVSKRSAKTKKAPIGPRTSDRDSGVLGRIRAASAGSLIGRSILGAYPGDANPLSEAASASGLYELAEKYGYEDLSDTGEGPQDDPIKASRRRRYGRFDGISAKSTQRRKKVSPLDFWDEQVFNNVPETSSRSDSHTEMEIDKSKETTEHPKKAKYSRTQRRKTNSVVGAGVDRVVSSIQKRKAEVQPSRQPRKEAVTTSKQVETSTVVGAGVDRVMDRLRENRAQQRSATVNNSAGGQSKDAGVNDRTRSSKGKKQK